MQNNDSNKTECLIFCIIVEVMIPVNFITQGYASLKSTKPMWHVPDGMVGHSPVHQSSSDMQHI